MKILPLLGFASLAANVVLLGALAVGAFRAKPVAPATAAVAASTPPQKTASPAVGSDTWTELNATDFTTQRDRLQAEGFPPSLIRSILAAQIREQNSARRKAIDSTSPDHPYWRNPLSNPAAQAQLRALAKEEQKVLKELLGTDPVNSSAARLQREFPAFSTEKIDQLVAIRERYDELRQEIYGSGYRGSSITPSEREKLNAFEKTMQGELAAVLTPEEFENYQLRTSNTSNSLRYELANFEVTEAEFRALHRLKSAFDDQHRYVGTLTQEQMRARSDAQKLLNQDIAVALGAARYEEYQRATDYHFRQTSQLVSRLNLPPETASTIYAVQKDAEKRRDAVYRDSTPEGRTQINEKLTTIASDATARIHTLLGGNQTAVEAYKQQGGNWLTYFIPRPAPTATRPPVK